MTTPPKPIDKDQWKREVSEVLKRHGKVSPDDNGRIALVVSQGGVRDALWLEKKMD